MPSVAFASVIRRLKRRSLAADVIAFVGVLCLALSGLEGWHAWHARTLAIADDRVETSNLGRSLAQHAHDTVLAADTSLIGLRERIETDGLGPKSLARLRTLMQVQVASLPVLHGLFVFDAEGNGIANSLAEAGPVLNYADRSYFKAHRADPSRAVVIGNPVHSKTDGSWIITVSRRLDTPDGRFMGVVEATISIDFLQRFYATFDVGSEGALGLMTTSGILIARSPAAENTIGMDLSASPVFRSLVTAAATGSFEYRGAIDHVLRFGSYRRVEDYPLLVLVAHGQDEVLAGWWTDTAIDIVGGLAAMAALFLLGHRIVRQMRRREEAEQRYRLLADNSSDAIVCVTLDGRRLYVSPAFTELTGWSVAEALEQRWGASVHAEDQGRVLAMPNQLRTGTGQLTDRFRYLCRDGSVRWVEARLKLVADVVGEGQGGEGEGGRFIVNIRDVSARKAAEDEIVELNRRLAAQARTDALTGLDNRRSFDEAMSVEWARAARDRKPLSLLMIDLDHFKRYNDRYGHQQGDACLRAVAAALEACGRRPGDLAARYGGEELVLLLPGTDEGAARQMAATAREAIAALGLMHLDNPPSGRVTASIGVATARPCGRNEQAGVANLIGAADVALYRAKRSGRDRFVEASPADAFPALRLSVP
jgi:diguanylate cyclase (GGDEF)-like protein/PAS domain S-box-containing protein